MAVTHYLWDTESDNVLTEFDDSYDTTAVYTNKPGEFGDLVSQRRDSATSWYHSDGLGSTRELTDSSETVTDTNVYDAWGSDVESTGSTENPFRWVGAKGYYYDTELESYYVRARTYEPTIARWTSRDPLGFNDDWNLYLYVFDNPLVFDDSSGMRLSPRTRPVDPTITIVQQHAPRPTCSRGGIVDWTFRLSTRAPCNGFIVQKIEVWATTGECNSFSTYRMSNFVYWEAWPVRRRARGPANEAGRSYTDRARVTPKSCSVGVCSQKGEVRFYCNSDVGLDPRRSFASIPGWDAVGGEHVYYHDSEDDPVATTPGDLTSTGDQPLFWEDMIWGFETASYRSFLVNWQCCPQRDPCCGGGASTVETSYNPTR